MRSGGTLFAAGLDEPTRRGQFRGRPVPVGQARPVVDELVANDRVDLGPQQREANFARPSATPFDDLETQYPQQCSSTRDEPYAARIDAPTIVVRLRALLGHRAAVKIHNGLHGTGPSLRPNGIPVSVLRRGTPTQHRITGWLTAVIPTAGRWHRGRRRLRPLDPASAPTATSRPPKHRHRAWR